MSRHLSCVVGSGRSPVLARDTAITCVMKTCLVSTQAGHVFDACIVQIFFLELKFCIPDIELKIEPIRVLRSRSEIMPYTAEMDGQAGFPLWERLGMKIIQWMDEYQQSSNDWMMYGWSELSPNHPWPSDDPNQPCTGWYSVNILSVNILGICVAPHSSQVKWLTVLPLWRSGLASEVYWVLSPKFNPELVSE